MLIFLEKYQPNSTKFHDLFNCQRLDCISIMPDCMVQRFAACGHLGWRGAAGSRVRAMRRSFRAHPHEPSVSRICTLHPCPGCIPNVPSPGLHPGLVCVDPLGQRECCRSCIIQLSSETIEPLRKERDPVARRRARANRCGDRQPYSTGTWISLRRRNQSVKGALNLAHIAGPELVMPSSRIHDSSSSLWEA